MLILKILGALAALGIGIWLGLPGRYRQTHHDIERSLDHPARRSRKVKRHFTPLAWFQRKAAARRAQPRARRGFKVESPEDR
jgi:ribosomal protein L20